MSRPRTLTRYIVAGALTSMLAAACGLSEGDASAAQQEALVEPLPRCDFLMHLRIDSCRGLLAGFVPLESLEFDFDWCVPGLTAALQSRADTAACPSQPYIDAGVDLHRKLYKRLGTARLSSTGRAGLVDSGDPAVNRTALNTYLDRVQAWYDGWAPILDGQQLASELGYLQALFWEVLVEARQLDAQLTAVLAPGIDPATQDQRVAEVLAQRDNLAGALEREVVEALFPASGRLPMRGVPLLAALGQALTPLYHRLETLVPHHDYACELAQCGTRGRATPVSHLFDILAHLDDGVAMQDGRTLRMVLDAQSTFAHGGWRPLFYALAAQAPQLKAALDAAMAQSRGAGASYGPGDADGPKTGWPPASARFVEVLYGALERHRNYVASGQLGGAVGRNLRTAVHYEKRADVNQAVTRLAQALRNANASYRQNLTDRVQVLMDMANATGGVEVLRQKRTQLWRDLEDLEQRRTGHIAAGALAVDLTAELAAELEKLNGVVGDTPMMEVAKEDGGAPIRLAGVGKYVSRDQPIPELAARGPIPVNRGQLLQLAVTPGSRWTPVCALGQVSILSPQGQLKDFEVGAAECGPEGFDVSWNSSSYSLESQDHASGTTFRAGVKAEVCATSTLGEAFGMRASACAYTDFGYSSSDTYRQSEGSDARTSAAFSGGLHLTNTPFPEAPVGALVAVELPRGATRRADIRDVHLIRSGNTSLPVQADSDVYLVVNDAQCAAAPTANQLELTISTLSATREISKNLLDRMEYVLRKVRREKAGLEQRREILSTELSAIRQNALLDLMQNHPDVEFAPTTPQVTLSSYPESLRALLTAFLDRELLRLERAVRLANLGREIEIKKTELRASNVELANAQANQALVTYLPAWNLRDIYGEFVRHQTDNLVRTMQEYFLPVFRVWYPDVWQLDAAGQSRLTRSGTGAAGQSIGQLLDALLDMRVDDPLDARAENMLLLTELALQSFEQESLKKRDAANIGDVVRSNIVLSLGLNPSYEPVPGFVEDLNQRPFSLRSPYRGIAAPTAQRVWTSLKHGGLVHIQLQPEDLYGAGQTTGDLLACTRELPVLRNVALVARSATEPQAGVPRAFNDQRFDVRQPFITANGPVETNLIGDAAVGGSTWLRVKVRQLFTTTNNTLDWGVDAAVATDPVAGLSPVGRLSLEANPANWTAWGYNAVEELFLVLQVETTRANQPLRWISSCR